MDLVPRTYITVVQLSLYEGLPVAEGGAVSICCLSLDPLSLTGMPCWASWERMRLVLMRLDVLVLFSEEKGW